jgi:hypothetical protein
LKSSRLRVIQVHDAKLLHLPVARSVMPDTAFNQTFASNVSLRERFPSSAEEASTYLTHQAGERSPLLSRRGDVGYGFQTDALPLCDGRFTSYYNFVRAKTLIIVAAVLAILFLFGLYERRVYCDSPASFTTIERDGASSSSQSFVRTSFSLK